MPLEYRAQNPFRAITEWGALKKLISQTGELGKFAVYLVQAQESVDSGKKPFPLPALPFSFLIAHHSLCEMISRFTFTNKSYTQLSNTRPKEPESAN